MDPPSLEGREGGAPEFGRAAALQLSLRVRHYHRRAGAKGLQLGPYWVPRRLVPTKNASSIAGVSRCRYFSCPSWARTRTLLIQSQTCCQLHQGAVPVNHSLATRRKETTSPLSGSAPPNPIV